MDELNELLPALQSAEDPKILIGTVTYWNSTTGAGLTIDGTGAETTKRYKIMQTGRPLYKGNRYLLLKISGTYVVLGEIGLPPRQWSNIGDLSSDATLSNVISKVNTILAILRENGQIKMT